MAKFPTRKSDIRALAQAILAGLQTNPLVFPTPPFDSATLAALIVSDNTNRTTRQNLEAQLEAAVEAENTGIELMEAAMKQQILQCEASYPDDASKLELIGYGPGNTPQSSVQISQPLNLHATVQGPGSIILDWHSPATGRTSLRFYKIERQITQLGTNTVTEDWGVWMESATKSEKELLNQPRGVQIAYRVSAVNSSMTSTPSNSVIVVL